VIKQSSANFVDLASKLREPKVVCIWCRKDDAGPPTLFKGRKSEAGYAGQSGPARQVGRTLHDIIRSCGVVTRSPRLLDVRD
jgi:hypothetical protein